MTGATATGAGATRHVELFQRRVLQSIDPPRQTGMKDVDVDGVEPKEGVEGEAAVEEAEVRPACKEEGRTSEHARLSWNWPVWHAAALTQCPTGTSQPSGLFCHVLHVIVVLKTPTLRKT